MIQVKCSRILREINKEKPKEKIILVSSGEKISDEKEITEEITKFFKKLFISDKNSKSENISPKQMENPFTVKEVEDAVKKLKNNKSAGSDSIHAEQLKYGPTVLYTHIAEIFNNMTKTGVFPEELITVILIPLPKNGKENGKIKNLRPVILLNRPMIRKILAIIVLNRIYNRIDGEIPITQTAYRSGRRLARQSNNTSWL